MGTTVNNFFCLHFCWFGSNNAGKIRNSCPTQRTIYKNTAGLQDRTSLLEINLESTARSNSNPYDGFGKSSTFWSCLEKSHYWSLFEVIMKIVHLNKRSRNLGRRFFTAQKAPVANIWGPINVMNYLKRLSHRCKIVRILLPLLHPFRGWFRACNGVHSSEIGVFIF